MVNIIDTREQAMETLTDLGISCILVPVSVRGALEMNLLNKLFDLPSERCRACDEYIQVPQIGAVSIFVPCYDEESSRFEYDRLIKEVGRREESHIAVLYKRDAFDLLFGEHIFHNIKIALEKSKKEVTLILLS